MKELSATVLDGKKIGFLTDCNDLAIQLSEDAELSFLLPNELASIVGAKAVSLNDEKNLKKTDLIVFEDGEDEQNEVLLLAAGLKRRNGKPLLVPESVFRDHIDETLRAERKRIRLLAESPSVFDPAIFLFPRAAAVRERALAAVSEPLRLDREGNRCAFVSTSDRQEYSVSLAACTCPAFRKGGGRACKHMFRLAMELGLTE